MTPSREDIDRQMAKAESARRDEEYNKAVSILNAIIKKNPEYAPAYREVGSILTYSQSQEKALLYLNKSIELSSQDMQNHISLVQFYKNAKRYQEALESIQKALEIDSTNPRLYYKAYEIHRILESHDTALLIIQKVIELDPDNIALLHTYAEYLHTVDQRDKSLQVYEYILKKQGDEIETPILEGWYLLMVELEKTSDAMEYLSHLLQYRSYEPALHRLYGKSCLENGRYHDAIDAYNRSDKLLPNNIETYRSLSIVYTILGDREKAGKYLRDILRINPLDMQSLGRLSENHKYSYGDTEFKRLSVAKAHLSDLSDKDKVYLHHALAKAYSDVGELKSAFAHYKIGGDLRSNDMGLAELGYMHKLVTDMRKIKPIDIIEKNDLGHSSNKPIFIVGMPRFGTTLLEQVLSSLDGVYGAGELNYGEKVLDHISIDDDILYKGCPNPIHNIERFTYAERGKKYLELIEQISPKGSQRVIDKMPHNFQWVGLLHLILPNASIIHVRRHPVETCLSAYRINFKEGHYWSDDLAIMGKYYKEYYDLMKFWKSLLPKGTMIEVKYEDMVSDLEGESKRIAEYIDMPWSPKCLEFHKSQRAVKTASVTQVREPIYTRSTNRWRKYEPYLQPLLDEIGDIVEEYEAELAKENHE